MIFLLLVSILCCCGLLINITHSWYLVIDMNDCSIFIKLHTNKYNLWTFCDLRSADFSYPQILQKINNHRKYSLYGIQTTDENNKEGCTLYLCIVVILLSSYFPPTQSNVSCRTLQRTPPSMRRLRTARMPS